MFTAQTDLDTRETCYSFASDENIYVSPEPDGWNVVAIDTSGFGQTHCYVTGPYARHEDADHTARAMLHDRMLTSDEHIRLFGF